MHHDTRALRLACPSGLLTTIRKVLGSRGCSRGHAARAHHPAVGEQVRSHTVFGREVEVELKFDNRPFDDPSRC